MEFAQLASTSLDSAPLGADDLPGPSSDDEHHFVWAGKPMTLEFLQCYLPILNPVELIWS